MGHDARDVASGEKPQTLLLAVDSSTVISIAKLSKDFKAFPDRL